MQRLVKPIVLSAAFMVLLGTTPVFAQQGGWQYQLELFGGYYDPKPDVMDEGNLAGLRFGRMTQEMFRFDVTVGYFEGDLLTEEGDDRDLTYESFFVNFDETLLLNPDGSVHPTVVVGVGWAWAKLVGHGSGGLGSGFEKLDEGTLSVNAGLGLEVELGSRASLRPVVRARWFEARDQDEVDLEATLGIAFSL
jgi:hypothetical protein